jgi:hypothetical protein
MTQVQLQQRNIEIQQGGAAYSGFRVCHDCGYATHMLPTAYPYHIKAQCSCGQPLVPLLDTEVLYYISQMVKIKHFVAGLQQFLSIRVLP